MVNQQNGDHRGRADGVKAEVTEEVCLGGKPWPHSHHLYSSEVPPLGQTQQNPVGKGPGARSSLQYRAEHRKGDK